MTFFDKYMYRNITACTLCQHILLQAYMFQPYYIIFVRTAITCRSRCISLQCHWHQCLTKHHVIFNGNFNVWCWNNVRQIQCCLALKNQSEWQVSRKCVWWGLVPPRTGILHPSSQPNSSIWPGNGMWMPHVVLYNTKHDGTLQEL